MVLILMIKQRLVEDMMFFFKIAIILSITAKYIEFDIKWDNTDYLYFSLVISVLIFLTKEYGQDRTLLPLLLLLENTLLFFNIISIKILITAFFVLGIMLVCLFFILRSKYRKYP